MRHDLPIRFPLLLLAITLETTRGLSPGAAAAAPDPLKASRACRQTIVKEGAKLATTALKLVDACHAERAAGKRADDCNDLAAQDRKGKLPKAEGKAAEKLAKKCAPADPVRANFFAADPAPALAALARAGVEASAAETQGLLDLGGDKSLRKCHRALGKTRTAIVQEILKATAKCQKARDKTAAAFGAVDAACVVTAAKQGPKAVKALARACAGLTGPEVGSCPGLPQCLIDDATATGQALAAGLYAQPVRPFDGRVAVLPDAARAATATLGPEGGTLAATGADGTSYTLELPAGALIVPESITLTPVAAIGDLPLTGGLVAAVQFAPEGLQLVVPATLTIALPQAVDPAGLVGFDWTGLGGGFGLDLVAVEGQTLTLAVTHFSGAGAGTAAPTDLGALRGLPGSSVRTAAGAALAALFTQGVTTVGPYAAILADWYDAGVAPALAVAVTSDPALRDALRDYVQWHTTVEVVGAFFGDLEALLGADGFALATRREAAAPLLVAGLQAGLARAKADCRAQQSLARAEDAFRWALVAGQLGLATAGNGLDRDGVLEDFCVAASFAELAFPASLTAGVAATLRVRVGYAFTGPIRFDQPFAVITSPSGTVEGLDVGAADPDGRYQTAFTPTGDAAVALEVSGCLASAAFPALSLFNLCQRALVVRGDLAVVPGEVALAPAAQQQFTAELFGVPTGAVTWSATGGTITAGGLYTAGDEPGTYTVTATSTLDPSLEATAEIAITPPAFAITAVRVADYASGRALYWHQEAVGQNPVLVEDRPDDHAPPEITSPDLFPIVGGVDLTATTLGSEASCAFTASADVASTASGVVVAASATAVASATCQPDERPVTNPGAIAGCLRDFDLALHFAEPWDFEMSATGSGDGFYTMELYCGGSLVACLTQNGGRRYRCIDGEVEDTAAPTEVIRGTLAGACTVRVTWSVNACCGFGCGTEHGPTSVATDVVLTIAPAAP